jgi:hypothetical protein
VAFDVVGLRENKMNIKKLKAKAAQYGSEIQTDPVQNWDWYQNEWRNNFDFILSDLFQDNRNRFREIWGKPSFCWRGEFYFHCWLLDIDGKAQMLVLTSKGKGTAYEVVFKRDGKKIRKDKNSLIQFMGYIKEKLDGYGILEEGTATVYGRKFNTFVFKSIDATNSFLKENKGFGVLVSIGDEHHVAKLEDEGK